MMRIKLTKVRIMTGSVAITIPQMLAYEVVKTSSWAIGKKVVDVVEKHLDLNKLVIITACALSSLALVASIYYASMMSVSLSASLLVASCLSYRINLDLADKKGELRKLRAFIIDEGERKREREADHEKLQEAVSRLELTSKQQEAFIKEQQSKLARALELVEFCDHTVQQATEFTRRSESVSVEHRAISTEHKALNTELRSISAELDSYKGVLGVWLVEMKKMIDTGDDAEKSSQKVIRILDDFSRGQHLELSRMLDQHKKVQEQIELSNGILRDQQQTLQVISQDIVKRTSELHDIHLKLSSLHLELIRKKAPDVLERQSDPGEV